MSKRLLSATSLVNMFSVLLIVRVLLPMPSRGSLVDGDGPIVEKYRQLIPQFIAEQDIPGLAVAVVDETDILWTERFGFTDDDHKTAITPDTIFSVQSTSKTFTATAVMLAVQDGHLDLDVPITTCLSDGDTTLTGLLSDQAALYGLLLRLRDFGLSLVSVNPV